MKIPGDKSVPIVCLILSIFLGLIAWLLFNINESSATSTEISLSSILERPQPEIVISDEAKLEIENFRILLVPGHDDENHGAEFLDNENLIKESDFNLNVTNELLNILEKDKQIETFITRTENGYTKEFLDYFETEKESILEFKKESDKKSKFLKDDPIEEVHQNKVPAEVSFKLHGINKWANENEIDLVVHAHFNEYPRKDENTEGDYSGFSIYIPKEGFKNNPESAKFAENIRDYLNDVFPETNAPVESDVVIQDSDLIAIGAHNSLNSPSVLVEYGFIYEPKFRGGNSEQVFKSLATQTYLGIKKTLFDF